MSILRKSNLSISSMSSNRRVEIRVSPSTRPWIENSVNRLSCSRSGGRGWTCRALAEREAYAPAVPDGIRAMDSSVPFRRLRSPIASDCGSKPVKVHRPAAEHIFVGRTPSMGFAPISTTAVKPRGRQQAEQGVIGSLAHLHLGPVAPCPGKRNCGNFRPVSQENLHRAE